MALAQARAKVLVVDDRPDNLLALEAALQDPVYDLMQVRSGKEALKCVREHDFAVIILDVQMPVMDGFATASLIRLEPRARLTPIIFVTASHDSEFREQQGYDVGAVDYLIKPLKVGVLRAKVSVFVELFRKNQEIQKQALLINERDEFLSIASHELKTPITPLSLQMQAFLNLLDRGLLETVPRERLKRMLSTSYAQVARLTHLIDELLDVSRLTAGKMTLSPADMSLSELLQSISEAYAVEAQKAGCELKIKAEGGLSGHWDRFRLEQVVINLLTNALKYGAGTPVELTAAEGDGGVRITVKDGGIGIAKEDHERIFNRYERAASARHFGGLGLGLYISNEIVKLHGGKIEVDSRPGAGATFTIELPRPEPTSSAS